ncbi:MAG: hypothetical protein KGS72_23455 [Cyanobacteria bacterium REEB67]|nr:hypothetical protein [Cyanobacteria bacterium REEB67]
MSNSDNNKDGKKTGWRDFDEFAKQFEPLIQKARARRRKMLWGIAIAAFTGTFITGYVLASGQAGFCFFIVAMFLLYVQAERTKI